MKKWILIGVFAVLMNGCVIDGNKFGLHGMKFRIGGTEEEKAEKKVAKKTQRLLKSIYGKKEAKRTKSLALVGSGIEDSVALRLENHALATLVDPSDCNCELSEGKRISVSLQLLDKLRKGISHKVLLTDFDKMGNAHNKGIEAFGNMVLRSELSVKDYFSFLEIAAKRPGLKRTRNKVIEDEKETISILTSVVKGKVKYEDLSVEKLYVKDDDLRKINWLLGKKKGEVAFWSMLIINDNKNEEFRNKLNKTESIRALFESVGVSPDTHRYLKVFREAKKVMVPCCLSPKEFTKKFQSVSEFYECDEANVGKGVCENFYLEMTRVHFRDRTKEKTHVGKIGRKVSEILDVEFRKKRESTLAADFIQALFGTKYGQDILVTKLRKHKKRKWIVKDLLSIPSFASKANKELKKVARGLKADFDRKEKTKRKKEERRQAREDAKWAKEYANLENNIVKYSQQCGNRRNCTKYCRLLSQFGDGSAADEILKLMRLGNKHGVILLTGEDAGCRNWGGVIESTR